MNSSRPVQVLFGAWLFLASVACLAAPENTGDESNPEYAIEIVVFQYLNPDDGDESYASDSKLPDFSGMRPLASVPELVPLEPDELKLGGEAYTFRRGANYRLLLHAGWHQKLTDRNSAESVYVRYPRATKRDTLVTIPGLSFIQSGKDAPVMEGAVQVALERYLHLTVDLVYRPDSSSPAASHQSDVYVEPDSPYEEIQVSSPVYRLRETRRMRSGQVHYLDHPHIGVIALIRRFRAPAAKVPADSNTGSTPAATTGEPAQ